jgi:hypothetical protein
MMPTCWTACLHGQPTRITCQVLQWRVERAAPGQGFALRYAVAFTWSLGFAWTRSFRIHGVVHAMEPCYQDAY